MSETIWEQVLPQLMGEAPAVVVLGVLGYLMWRSLTRRLDRCEHDIHKVRSTTDRELRPNHGTSVYDRVIKLEESQKGQDTTLNLILKRLTK